MSARDSKPEEGLADQNVGALPQADISPAIPQDVVQPGVIVGRRQKAVQVWQSPYPPPDAMRVYEDLLPGAMERIIAMAEKGQQAQIDDSVRSFRLSRSGQWLGAATTALALGLAAFLAKEAPVIAGLMLGVPVLAVARALIPGNRGEKPQD